MPDKVLTLLDMTKISGSDQAVGLVEEVVTTAPELEELLGVPINGITYKIRKRTALASAGFRNANEGSDLAASSYEASVGSCYFLDVPCFIDEAVVEARMAEGSSLNDVKVDEASGALRSSIIAIGDQFYRGTTKDAKGFPGLLALHDAANCVVDATGTPGSATSVWLVWNDIQGVHFIWGHNKGLQQAEWVRQYKTDANNKTLAGYFTNVKGWIGLRQIHSKAAVRIKNLTTAKPLTDALVAEALAKMPIWMRRSPNLRIFGNSVAELQLRKSRSTVSASKTDSGILQFAPPVTESNNVKFVLTDSIGNAE